MHAIIIANFVNIETNCFFMSQIYSRLIIYCVIFTPFLLSSCKDETHPIQSVPVNISINLDLPSYQSLNSPGEFAYVNGGIRGIVVYRNFDEFVALERQGTFNHEDECALVQINPDNMFQLIDSCSGSKYDIATGVVIEGPAKWALRRYTTSWNGINTVYIYN